MENKYIVFTVLVLSIALIGSILFGQQRYNIKPVGKPIKEKQKYVLSSAEQDFIAQYEAFILSSFEETNTPGAAIAIIKDGNLIYKKGLGFKSSDGQDSVDTKTLFRIASVSKGFSAVLAALVNIDSAIHWDDHIGDYLNFDVDGEASKITIQHILSHSAGFPYQAYSTLVEDEQPRDTMIRQLLEIPLPRAPGEIHSYQNVAYSMIENVLESATGKSFDELMYERIFHPLGMDDASLSYDSIINFNNKAMPHGYRNGRFVPTQISRSYYNVAAAGGLNLNIEDMSKWLNAMLGNNPNVIPLDAIDRVSEPVIPMRVKNPYFSNYDTPRSGFYGLGWRVMQYPSQTIVYHGGYANGYKSGIAMDRSRNIGICVLTNAPSKFSNIAMINFFKMYEEFHNAKGVATFQASSEAN